MQGKYIVKNDLVTATNIWIDTQQWFSWLDSINAFRYELGKTNFNVNKRSTGRWYATKKMYSSNGCRAVTLYIGSNTDCNLERLKEIAERFSMNYVDFWKWYYDPARKATRKQRTKVGEKDASISLTDEGVLQSELARLRMELEEVTQDRDRQLIRIAEMQNRMHDEIKSCTAFQDKQLEQLENYNREIDRTNGYLEKENAKLRDENYNLKMELNQLRADAIAPGHQENDQSTANHGWSLGSIQPRSELLKKSQSRRQFEKQGNYPILLDGSKWRRLGSKQDLPENEQCLGLFQYYAANTVFYICIG